MGYASQCLGLGFSLSGHFGSQGCDLAFCSVLSVSSGLSDFSVVAIWWPSVQWSCTWIPMCRAATGGLGAAGLCRPDNSTVDALHLGCDRYTAHGAVPALSTVCAQQPQHRARWWHWRHRCSLESTLGRTRRSTRATRRPPPQRGRVPVVGQLTALPSSVAALVAGHGRQAFTETTEESKIQEKPHRRPSPSRHVPPSAVVVMNTVADFVRGLVRHCFKHRLRFVAHESDLGCGQPSAVPQQPCHVGHQRIVGP